jgi:VIT1/CCC1 family predicted Fe2+/Mn2+ transporter
MEGEQHTELSPAVRDVIIGMSDGLTVPFAIAAGLASAATMDATIIIAAVLAEIAAGSVSMGLGGYLAANTEAEHYHAERRREEWEVDNKPDAERQEVADVFIAYGLTQEQTAPIVNTLAQNKKAWVDFMMRYELGLEEPDKRRALKSAATIAAAYALGGLIPLGPYLFLRQNVALAFQLSILATFVALLIFGYIRGRLVSAHPWKGMLQTVLVGGIAASAAFLLARLVP